MWNSKSCKIKVVKSRAINEMKRLDRALGFKPPVSLLSVYHPLICFFNHSICAKQIWMWDQEIFSDKQNQFFSPNPTKITFLHSLWWWWLLPKKPAKLINDEPQMSNIVGCALGGHQEMTSLDLIQKWTDQKMDWISEILRRKTETRMPVMNLWRWAFVIQLYKGCYPF